MEHSDEEKKAIEDLNKLTFLLDDVYSTLLIESEERDEYVKSIDIVLNLIDKQHSKIKELADYNREWIDSYCEENQKWQKERNENGRLKRLVKNSIPKKVIREKIEVLKEKIRNLHPASDCVIIDDLENQIKAYEELLGE